MRVVYKGAHPGPARDIARVFTSSGKKNHYHVLGWSTTLCGKKKFHNVHVSIEPMCAHCERVLGRWFRIL